MPNRPSPLASDAQSVGCDSCGLRRICFPERVTANGALRAHRLQIRKMRFARAAALFRSGESIESLYMVRSGCIKELAEPSGRRSSVINFVLPGEVLGIESLGGGASHTTGVAVEASSVCAVPRSALSALCVQSPAAAAEFIRFIAATSLAVRGVLMLIRDRGALERMAGFLLDISGRLQVRGERGREFRLAMNRDDIAAYLGMRSETVSRCFTELELRGLIKVRAKRIQILHAAALRGMFGGERLAC